MDSRFARGWISIAGALVLGTFAATAEASFPGENGAIGYAWSGPHLYRGSPPRSSSIRAVDPRSGHIRILRDCPPGIDTPSGFPNCFVGTPRYSPDGLRIAFSIVQVAYPPGEPWEYRPGLAVMAADGTPLADQATANSYARIAWSPAGDQFLLQRWLAPSGSPNAIFLASPDGTELSQVTPAWTQGQDWSSTGEIAFGRYLDPGCVPVCEDIFVTRLGGTSRRLTYRGGSSPSWSPHGRKLAFVRYGRYHRDVYLVGRDGQGLRRLTRRGGYGPSWSPDGKWIAFLRRGDLYVVRSSGRGLRRLVDGSGDEYGPAVGSLDWQALASAGEGQADSANGRPSSSSRSSGASRSRAEAWSSTSEGQSMPTSGSS